MNAVTGLCGNGVVVARDLVERDQPAFDAWCLDAVGGRFVEVSDGPSTAALSLTVTLVREAQERGSLVAWIGNKRSVFFPPDVASAGVDLSALPVVCTTTNAQAYRAADMLVRSGAFAVVVLDLGGKTDIPFSIQSRLVGLLADRRTMLLHITTERNNSPRGSLTSLRGRTDIQRIDHDSFVCEFFAVKDKRRVPGWRHREFRCGTDGLC